jgi:hypothetical protein
MIAWLSYLLALLFNSRRLLLCDLDTMLRVCVLALA